MKINDEEYRILFHDMAQLQIKVDQLDNHVKKCRKGEIENITLPEIHLLEEQLHYMRGYLRLLKQRLSIDS